MRTTKQIAILLAISLLFSLVVLCSCSQRASTEQEFKLETPSKSLQKRFVKEYVAFQGYNRYKHPTVAIETWYGSFGNAHFLLVFDAEITYTQALWTDYVAESSFSYPDGQSIIVWVNKQFLTIREAYEQNLITVEMIETIENIHNGSEGSPIKMLEH